ncbi:MAG: hypothetical protein ACR2NU_02975 [Aeoliella sp.]
MSVLWKRAARGARSAKAKRRLLFLLVVILALVVFAPTIVLRTPLRGQLLARLVPPNVGTVAAESITAGWFTPVSAEQITITDTAGNRLADIERLTMNRTISSLMANSRDLGTIRLEKPVVYTLVRPDGSSIEDAITAASEAAAAADTASSSSGGSVYRLEVVNGRVLSRDASTGVTWSAESLSATVEHPASAELSIEAAGFVRPALTDAALTNFPNRPEGSGRFELHWGPADETTHATRFVSGKFPLAALEPWVQRFDPQLRLAGELTGEMSGSFPARGFDSLSGTSNGRVSLSGLKVSAAALAGETLQLDQTDLAWRGTARGGRLAIERISLSSDVAMFDLRGTLPEPAVRRLTAGEEAILAVTSGDLEAEGRVNLARLAKLLPGLLQIRKGTTITEGQIRFTAITEPNGNDRKLTASLTTTPFAGVANGRPISWDVPLTVDLIARQTKGNVRFDRLNCESDFLKCSGSGDARQMQVEGQVDLDQLVRRLEQFVDLADWQLTGRGEINASCQTTERGRFFARGSGNFSNMVVAFQGDTLAKESRLEWKIDVDGDSPANAIWPSYVESGQVSLTAAGDQLTIQVAEPTPIDTSWSATEWPLKIVSTGNLNGWTRRLRPWIDLSSWRLSGGLDLHVQGRFRAEPLTASLSSSQLTIGSFEAVSENWEIREPRLEWSGDASWDATTGTLTSRGGQLLSSTVAASLRDWFWTSDPQQAQQVGGGAAVRMDLARLARMRRIASDDAAPTTPVGEVSGNIRLAAQQDQIVATVDLIGANVALEQEQPSLPGRPPTTKTVWQEPKLRVDGTVSYSPADDLLKQNLRVESNSLAIAASGSIENLTGEGKVNVAGTMDYDLANLSPIVAQFVGEGLTFAGRGPGRFEARGSLSAGNVEFDSVAGTPRGPRPVFVNSAEFSSRPSRTIASTWQARLLAPWQSANLYGLQVGQGRISAELADGRVAIEPLDFAVGGGQFTATPSIRLDPAPGEVSLAPGPLLTNVRITQDVSERMLKYIAPQLAGATRSEGVFSMNLTGARVPLGAPETADVAGQLVVQSGKIVPGPMVEEWVGVAREIEALARGRTAPTRSSGEPTTQMVIRDRNVSFQLVDGRVYHQGLEFEVEKFVFRSRGSVGLDQSLSLVIEIPIQGEWIDELIRKAPYLAGLRGKSIELPVTGTFSKWRMDRQAAKRQAKELFRDVVVSGDAVRGAIGNELNRALNKWLGGE